MLVFIQSSLKTEKTRPTPISRLTPSVSIEALKPTPVLIQAHQFQFKPTRFNSSPTVSFQAHQFQLKHWHQPVLNQVMKPTSFNSSLETQERLSLTRLDTQLPQSRVGGQGPY